MLVGSGKDVSLTLVPRTGAEAVATEVPVPMTSVVVEVTPGGSGQRRDVVQTRPDRQQPPPTFTGHAVKEAGHADVV